jgi:hypothetical protein
VVQRLKAYGVPDDRIFLTGFPLPLELLGGPELPTLKADLGQRLFHLDPHRKFWQRHGVNVEHHLGAENCTIRSDRVLTITYSIGGAGAMKEIGARIARSLKDQIFSGQVRLILAAGTKPAVITYYEALCRDIGAPPEGIRVISAPSAEEYFVRFNEALRTTDILWTKPSELSFYAALGIPIGGCATSTRGSGRRTRITPTNG